MRSLDWLVLIGSLVGVVFYGLWRGYGSKTTQQYLLADKTMPWYAMALSIMATQASAITFILHHRPELCGRHALRADVSRPARWP